MIAASSLSTFQFAILARLCRGSVNVFMEQKRVQLLHKRINIPQLNNTVLDVVSLVPNFNNLLFL